LLPDEILLVVGGRAASGYEAAIGGRDVKIEWLKDLPSLDRMLGTA
jgi:hypothetical protein